MILPQIILLILLGIAAWFLPRGWNLLAVNLIMLASLVTFGIRGMGRPAGAFINGRKTLSLARFQFAIWMILFLSTFLVLSFDRIHAGTTQVPLALLMDWRHWTLMGIATTTLVAAPMIDTMKRLKEPFASSTGSGPSAGSEGKFDVLAAAVRSLGINRDELDRNRQGILFGNGSVKDAAFKDLFFGDELATRSQLDFVKIQLFFFTVITALSYAVLIFRTVLTVEPAQIMVFPVIPDGMVILLGISHAGYLVNKVVDHTRTLNGQGLTHDAQ